MSNWYEDNSLSIGHTPLVRINRITQNASATVLAKVEGRNPAYSVKCRIGANMVWDAEKRGLLGNGQEIIEPTSGNTGIALCFVAASRGYKITIVMPETMSMERRKLMQYLGATLVLTEGAKGMKGAIAKAEELVASEPGRYFMPQQFKNPANPEAHFKTTGPEIWEQSGGDVDILVSAVGTGGTLTGTAKYLKTVNPKLTAVAVEPDESPVISQTLAGEAINIGPHKIQGIGAGFIPDTLDLNVVDRVERVNSADAISYSQRLAKEEGILTGISCGAAMAAADRLARLPENAGKKIVVILPDAAERYLSTALFD